jgi:hypothetical protein
MCSTGMLHAGFLPIFYFYQTKYFQAVLQFKNSKADAQSAKGLKKASYAPFLILLGGFMATTVYTRIIKRSELKAKQLSDAAATD